MFKRIVNAIEILVLVAFVVFFVLLFANEPGSTSANGKPPSPGAAVFAANCASCHGSVGEGYIGPQLAGGKVSASFPDLADEVKVVTNGRSGMPAFGKSLSATDISLVVDYTRTL